MSLMFRFVSLSLLIIGCASGNLEAPEDKPRHDQSTELVQTSEDGSAPWADNNEALFVFSGGFRSCGDYGPHSMNSYPAFRYFLKELMSTYPELEPQFLVTCLAEDAPPNGLAYFSVGVSDETYWTTSGYLADAINELAPRDMPIYMIGHSYGGWLSMFNLLALEGNHDRTVSGLFTIDPISPNGCDDNAFYHLFGGGFDTMFNFATGGMFGSWFTDGCREAPRDMPLDLARRTDHYNFYQRNGGYLQSGPMPGAYNLGIPGESHTSIATSLTVWAAITQAVIEDLRLD